MACVETITGGSTDPVRALNLPTKSGVLLISMAEECDIELPKNFMVSKQGSRHQSEIMWFFH